MMVSVHFKRAVIVVGLTVSCGVLGIGGGGQENDDVHMAFQLSTQLAETLKRIDTTGLKSGWTNFGLSVVALMAAGVAAFVVDSCQSQYCVKWIYKKSCEIKEKYFTAAAPSKLVEVIAQEGVPVQDTHLKSGCGGTKSR